MEALSPETEGSLHPRKGETEAREGKGLVRAPQWLDTELGGQQDPGSGPRA